MKIRNAEYRTGERLGHNGSKLLHVCILHLCKKGKMEKESVGTV